VTPTIPVETEDVRTVRRLDESRVPYAQSLQRDGLTLTEIAKRMQVPREEVVEALYWDVVSK
jgi:hypothetical protein